MKLAIIGSRSFDDYALLGGMVEEYFPGVTTIISGGARGADQLARQFAGERGLELQEYLPDWHQYGRAAGQIRNRLIIDDADEVLAFWDGISKGTRGGLEYAKKRGKKTVIAYISSAECTVSIVREDSLRFCPLGYRD